MNHRRIQIAEALAHYAAEFFVRESNGTSLITVTRADVSPDLKNSTIYISVMPESAEQDALAFAKRNRTELKAFIHKAGIGRPPFIEVVIDYGEKNRQAVDEGLRGK
ncbi:ribosome-binding factor A [bacterium]|nr:ribosome-binding factor A [bacterium]